MSMRMMMTVVAVLALSVAESAPIVKNGEKIAFMGASITQFGGEQDGGYVNLVIDGLERAGVKAVKIPAGVSGHKSDQMLARLDGVLAKKPDWMTLSCGGNDVGHGSDGVALEPDLLPNHKYHITSPDLPVSSEARGLKYAFLTCWSR